MKKALVLAGGGTRGAYQNGAIRALRELNRDDWDIVIGTSIGALNAAMVVQKDFDALDELWGTLTQDKIVKDMIPMEFDLNTMISERNAFAAFFKNYIREKGADVSPLIEQIHKYFRPEAFFSSPTQFGCITVDHGTSEPVYVDKERMKENAEKWLLASASAFPAFPLCHIDEADYVDGGYFDNLPIDFALRMGADQVTAIDLNSVPQHPNYMDRGHITYLFPKITTGSFLDFNPDKLKELDRLGYLDTMKEYGELDGVKYTFKRMRLPAYYNQYSLDLLKLETRIKLATSINERFRSADVVVERLKTTQHRTHLTEKQIFFGLMDFLLDLCGGDVTHIYTYKEARNRILAEFAETADSSYAYVPGLNPIKVIDYAKTLDTKGIIKKLVHGALFTEHSIFSENIRLTVYPFEEALALLIVAMMKELGGERQ